MKKKITIVIVLAIVALVIYAIAKHFLNPANTLSPKYNLDQYGTIDLTAHPIETNESLPLEATLKTPRGAIGVRIARTAAEQELGLSYFKSLQAGQGMLFVFDHAGIYPFWMKDMNFPLDIVWLKKISGPAQPSDASVNQADQPGQAGTEIFKVVYIAENVQPGTYPSQTFSSTEDADAVLEIGALTAKSGGFDVDGGTVSLVYNNPEK